MEVWASNPGSWDQASQAQRRFPRLRAPASRPMGVDPLGSKPFTPEQSDARAGTQEDQTPLPLLLPPCPLEMTKDGPRRVTDPIQEAILRQWTVWGSNPGPWDKSRNRAPRPVSVGHQKTQCLLGLPEIAVEKDATGAVTATWDRRTSRDGKAVVSSSPTPPPRHTERSATPATRSTPRAEPAGTASSDEPRASRATTPPEHQSNAPPTASPTGTSSKASAAAPTSPSRPSLWANSPASPAESNAAADPVAQEAAPGDMSHTARIADVAARYG